MSTSPPPQEKISSYLPPADSTPTAPPPQYSASQTEYHTNPVVYTPQQETTTLLGTQAITTDLPSTSRKPVLYNCHVCGTQQVTEVSYHYGVAFWFLCFLLCVLIHFFALFLFCVKDLKDVHHTCPNCGTKVGVKKAGF